MLEEARQALLSESRAMPEEGLGLVSSLGHPREDTDHNGAACTTIDCIFSTVALKEAESDRCFALPSSREAYAKALQSPAHLLCLKQATCWSEAL